MKFNCYTMIITIIILTNNARTVPIFDMIPVRSADTRHEKMFPEIKEKKRSSTFSQMMETQSLIAKKIELERLLSILRSKKYFKTS